MRSLPVLMALAVFCAAQAPTPRSVYVLPMASGFDQYLAEQIAREHVMQVVADPKLADTVLTDRLGQAFEDTLAKMHPASGAGTDVRTASKDELPPHPAFRLSGSRGTIFLVDSVSRRVLWSDYQNMSHSTASGVLNREAARVVKKLALYERLPAIVPR